MTMNARYHDYLGNAQFNGLHAAALFWRFGAAILTNVQSSMNVIDLKFYQVSIN